MFRKTKRPKTMNGLDESKIIEVPTDNDSEGREDSAHPTPPPTNAVRHTTRQAVHGRSSNILYDVKYHPADEVLRPANHRRRHGELFNRSDDTNSDAAVSQLGTSDEGDAPKPDKKRVRAVGVVRHSSRCASQKSVNYNMKIHPQDAILRQLEKEMIPARRSNITVMGAYTTTHQLIEQYSDPEALDAEILKMELFDEENDFTGHEDDEDEHNMPEEPDTVDAAVSLLVSPEESPREGSDPSEVEAVDLYHSSRCVGTLSRERRLLLLSQRSRSQRPSASHKPGQSQSQPNSDLPNLPPAHRLHTLPDGRRVEIPAGFTHVSSDPPISHGGPPAKPSNLPRLTIYPPAFMYSSFFSCGQLRSEGSLIAEAPAVAKAIYGSSMKGLPPRRVSGTGPLFVLEDSVEYESTAREHWETATKWYDDSDGKENIDLDPAVADSDEEEVEEEDESEARPLYDPLRELPLNLFGSQTDEDEMPGTE